MWLTAGAGTKTDRTPPTTIAIVVNGEQFNEFTQFPFQHCLVSAVAAAVVFMNTDDPYFYDLEDRKRFKVDLAEEVAYDDAVACGATTLTLEGWVREQRA